MERRNAYIVFADIKNYSKLEEGMLKTVFEEVWVDATRDFKPFQDKLLASNTWGDALFIVSENAAIVKAVLSFRDYFRKTDFAAIGLPDLAARIACHFGSCIAFEDAVSGRPNAPGEHINTAARIEPVTRPNEIFVTEDFKQQFERDSDPDKPNNVRFDALGELTLAKNFGSRDIYRLRTESEGEHIIDRLVSQDLMRALPDVSPPTVSDDRLLAGAKGLLPDLLKNSLTGLRVKGETDSYLAGLAELCKSRGLYSETIDIVEELEQAELEADDITVYPFRHDERLLKTKANALTRLGRYQEAAQIVYGLWRAGHQDSDTLSMLAAQYKRRALMTDGDGIRPDPERELLTRARDLYLEAFRRNIGDYYPAINAAYLCVMLGGDDKGKGRKLAGYIREVWEKDFGRDWWLSGTIAECYLLEDEFSTAIDKLRQAIETTNPPYFELQSTRDQVRLYREVQNEPEAEAFISVLEDRLEALRS